MQFSDRIGLAQSDEQYTSTLGIFKLNQIVCIRQPSRKGLEFKSRSKPFMRICCFCWLGGDGPKRALLEDVCEQCKLQDRVQFLGKLAHENVRDVSEASVSLLLMGSS